MDYLSVAKKNFTWKKGFGEDKVRQLWRNLIDLSVGEDGLTYETDYMHRD